ncbi:MAG: hypothetical protein FJ011_10140 [Chloroflexi bacterium]|nr:hypothetical protein [Chloroflexota bacterium]
MPALTFTRRVPSPVEFRRALAEAIAASNPVDDLLVLADQLREYEQKYHLSSAAFAQGYEAGNLDDTLQHCTEWIATYDLFVKTKRVVEATLMRAAVQPELAEVMA